MMSRHAVFMVVEYAKRQERSSDMNRMDAILVAAVILLFLLAKAYGQNPSLVLPDAPSASRNPKEVEASKPRRWSDVKFRSNRETLGNRSMWAFDGILVLSETFKAEMSTHQGVCVEGGGGVVSLPPHPTRWQLYKANLPEEGFGIAWAFIATKVKMPRWLMFAVEVYPVQYDIRDGLAWRNCWR